MITARLPQEAGDVARTIKVEGACGHVWDATTTKANLIEWDQADKWDRAHVRLYCARCYREGHKARGNLTPVRAVTPPDPIRYCENTSVEGRPHRVRLRKGHGPLCGACEYAEARSKVATVTTTEDRLLEYLRRRGRRSAQGLAVDLHMSLPAVRRMLVSLVEQGLVKDDGYVHSSGSKPRRAYKLMDESSEEPA